MKLSLSIFILFTFLILSCKETIIENKIPKEFTNDLLHADLVGKVIQKSSKAKVFISQTALIDSVEINPNDGTFAFRDLRSGNYDVFVRAENFRIYSRYNVQLNGGSIVYLGEVDLSTVPDLISDHYPENNAEIVYDWRYGRISASIMFTKPMDRASVEKAFSTNPPSEGIFTWGNYTQSPTYGIFADAEGFKRSATITTYSKITSMTYSFSRKDTYSDTLYSITLASTAKDTSGNFLRFPLRFSFRTVQSYTTQNGIMTNPVHGDIDVSPINNNGIIVTFPRRMNQASVEKSITLSPKMTEIYLWPNENELKIYTGGPFLSDTTITVSIDSLAKDKDGIALGHTFTFSFRTAALGVNYTYPINGQIFAPISEPIRMQFNNYIMLSSVQSAISISPTTSGTFSFGGYGQYESFNEIKFTPSSSFQPNIKYTVTISKGVKDMFGVPMKNPYSFSFVTRPN